MIKYCLQKWEENKDRLEQSLELIKALRCKSNDINNCTSCMYRNACYSGTLEEIAADALEAAEKRIAEQQKQIAQLYMLLNNRINEIAELEAQIPAARR